MHMSTHINIGDICCAGKEHLGNIVEPPVIKRVYCGKKHSLALDEEVSVFLGVGTFV
jgi:hypothetical protein